MAETPDHRTGFATRSGDSHVIGEDGQLQNIDQAARDALSRPPAAEGADGTNVAAASLSGSMPPAGEVAQTKRSQPAPARDAAKTDDSSAAA